jgi:hypothetical protein
MLSECTCFPFELNHNYSLSSQHGKRGNVPAWARIYLVLTPLSGGPAATGIAELRSGKHLSLHLQVLSMNSVCAHSGKRWLSFLLFAGFAALLH